MATSTTQAQDSSGARTLFMALELALKEWKLAFTIGSAQKPRVRRMPARDLVRLSEEIRHAKQRFGLPREARVASCYEAGRDGFWLHRALEASGVRNVVVDAGSLEVRRRQRRAKTDRLDATRLVERLVRFREGEKVWSRVRVPTVSEEDARHLHRHLQSLKRSRTAQVNRIKGLLIGVGVRAEVKPDFLEGLDSLRLWDGQAVPKRLQERLRREFRHWEFLVEQISQVEAEQKSLLKRSEDVAVEKVRHLMRLKSLGINTAWPLVMELFAWRPYENRRHAASLVGLVPTPHQSGDSTRDLGISKAGAARLRALMVELGWLWIRNQPTSRLSVWYEQRFAHAGRRQRKVGIVALARRLLIELWRYVEDGVIPEGAELKS